MADHRHALEERGKALTEEALQLVAGSGVEAPAAVVDARPADGLRPGLRAAGPHDRHRTYGERPMGFVLGSTKLLHRSPVPVLVVPAPEPEPGQRATRRRGGDILIRASTGCRAPPLGGGT